MSGSVGSVPPGPWLHRRGATDPSEVEARRARLMAMRLRWAAARYPPDNREVPGGFWSPTPILGFRFWYVGADCLHGVHQSWRRPSLEARCRLGEGAPHVGGCRCGVYALKEPEGLWQPGSVPRRPGAGIAYGLVALSGVVVEHEKGYRAARAEAVAVALQYGGMLAWGSDPEWLDCLFGRPQQALEQAWRWGRSMAAVGAPPGWADRFLHEEARRFERAWTSASRSG